MTALMKSVIRINQRDQHIDIQQCAHGLEALAVHQLLDMIQCHHFAA